jgi:hypothetical protein
LTLVLAMAQARVVDLNNVKFALNWKWGASFTSKHPSDNDVNQTGQL